MDTFELTRKYLLGNYARLPISFSRGKGCRIWDETGKEYLDFCAGIAVCSLGHAPSCMQKALAEQSATLIHCSNLYHIPLQAQLAEFIVEKVVQLPGKVFFANSGAEANDGAVKVARKFFFDRDGKGSRHEVITFRQSFHGRTLGGIAATGQEKVKIGFDPMLPGFVHLPFNDCEALRQTVSDKTAAILFEPIQGEGGIHVATPEFFQTIGELREKFGLLVMLDEVQCGFGRTGDWCGWRTVLRGSGVAFDPDVITWAKGMAGGFPMGAIWVSDRCAGAMGPGTHGSTFGGTPLACAVCLAVLKEIESSGCLDKIPALEKLIRDRAATWKFPQIKTLRGAGLMLGFELNPAAFNDPKPTPAGFLLRMLLDAGLVTVAAGPDVLRWLPPLNVTEAEVEEAFLVMEGVLSGLSQK